MKKLAFAGLLEGFFTERLMSQRHASPQATNPTVVPAATTWLVNVLSLDNAGPFTAGGGNVSFRAVEDITAPSKWFVWATPPRHGDDPTPLRKLRFINCLSVLALAVDALTPNFVSDYQAVNGSLNDPVDGGEWTEERYVWFQIRHYVNGQLGPAQTMRGQIQFEL